MLGQAERRMDWYSQEELHITLMPVSTMTTAVVVAYVVSGLAQGHQLALAMLRLQERMH